MRLGRSTGMIAGAAAIVVLCLASTAFACSALPSVVRITPTAAQSGTTVQLAGSSVPAKGAVEIRWNGVTGPLLSTAVADQQGNFTTAVELPDAAPGVYSLLAVTEGNGGVARVAVEVLPSVTDPVTITAVNSWTSVDGAAPPVEQRGDVGMLVGVGVLSIGLIALFSAATVAAVGRRRAPAQR